MNDCEQAYRLGAYMDGELSAGERATVESHLCACPSCQAEVQRLRRLADMLHQLEGPQIPTGAMERLHDSVDSTLTAGVRRLAAWSSAAAAVVLAACSISLMRSGGAPAQASPAAVATWETAAVARTPAEAAAAQDEQLATWVVRDLSGRVER